MAITDTSVIETATKVTVSACFEAVGVGADGRIIADPFDSPEGKYVVEVIEFDGCDLVEKCVTFSSTEPDYLCANGATYEAEIRVIRIEGGDLDLVIEDIACPPTVGQAWSR